MEAHSGKLAEQNHCGLTPRTKTSRQPRTQFFDGKMHDWLPDKSQAIRANRSKTLLGAFRTHKLVKTQNSHTEFEVKYPLFE